VGIARRGQYHSGRGQIVRDGTVIQYYSEWRALYIARPRRVRNGELLNRQRPAPVSAPVEEEKSSGGRFVYYVLAGSILLFFLVLLADIPKSKQTSRDPSFSLPASTSQTSKPKLKLTIEKLEMRSSGFLELVGVAEHIGDAAAFSPTITLEIFDKTGKTLLVQDRAWPEGQLSQSMQPGTSAAFRHFVAIPGEPKQVQWRLFAKDIPFEVVENYKDKKKR
jgi:hypothetical protein